MMTPEVKRLFVRWKVTTIRFISVARRLQEGGLTARRTGELKREMKGLYQKVQNLNLTAERMGVIIHVLEFTWSTIQIEVMDHGKVVFCRRFRLPRRKENA